MLLLSSYWEAVCLPPNLTVTVHASYGTTEICLWVTVGLLFYTSLSNCNLPYFPFASHLVFSTMPCVHMELYKEVNECMIGAVN